jgi:ABC-2 type transport system ATP-binding protein
MITVSSISKSYGRFTAVDDVSFVCWPGSVTGLLGLNGAGRTTTLRILVGLTSPSRGSALVGGYPYALIPNPGLHVGVLLDASAQHAGRTDREVLKVGVQTMGLPDSRSAMRAAEGGCP